MLFYKRTTISGLIHHVMKDSMYRNSVLLISSQAVNASTAFIFWIICAHIFNPHTIGLATSFIAFGALAATFTNLGQPTTVIRFLPSSKHKAGLFSASLSVVTLAAIFGSVIALNIIHIVAPSLAFVQSSFFLAIMLILLIIGNSINPLLDNTLMAYKKGQYIFIKSALASLPRLFVPVIFATLLLRGILITYIILVIIGVCYGMYILKTKIFKDIKLKPVYSEILVHKSFAANNYFGSVVGVLPSTLVPIIILNHLGAVQAAFYYIPMQLASFLGIIAGSTSQVLISEASQTNDSALHAKILIKSAKHLYRMLLPASIMVILFGWIVLRIYGSNYAKTGYAPLVILTIASLFVGINWIGDTWLIIKRRMGAYIFMNATNSLLVVGSVYILSTRGLLWAAVGWLLGQVVSAVVYFILFARNYIRMLPSSFKTVS